MRTEQGTVDEDTQEFNPFPEEMKMTEKTEAEKKAEKEHEEKSSGKKYDGGAIPKSSSKKNSSD